MHEHVQTCSVSGIRRPKCLHKSSQALQRSSQTNLAQILSGYHAGLLPRLFCHFSELVHVQCVPNHRLGSLAGTMLAIISSQLQTRTNQLPTLSHMGAGANNQPTKEQAASVSCDLKVAITSNPTPLVPPLLVTSPTHQSSPGSCCTLIQHLGPLGAGTDPCLSQGCPLGHDVCDRRKPVLVPKGTWITNHCMLPRQYF